MCEGWSCATGAGRPAYTCNRGAATYGEPICQGLSHGTALDELVARQLLAAVEPAALAASLAAVAGVERERRELTRQWELRRERAAYEVGPATRQYQPCEPENRLVARELERRWEEALKAQRQLDDDYGRWQRTAPTKLSGTAASSIRALAADLPAVWAAPDHHPRRWIRVGWVHVRRDGDGHHVIRADAGELRRLRELRQLPRDWANRARLAQLIKPGPRPAR